MLDRLLLSFPRSSSFDDASLHFETLEGSARNGLVIFLPWDVSIARAKQYCLLPAHFEFAYSMPPGIISSIPDRSAQAANVLLNDFRDRFAKRKPGTNDYTLVGLSIGNFPATYIANQYGANLLSIASGDRGEWLIFNSPAARHVRDRAISNNVSPEDIEPHLGPLNPVANLANIGTRSLFFLGSRDHFIPRPSQDRLREAIQRQRPELRIYSLPIGHALSILAWKYLPGVRNSLNALEQSARA